MKRVAWQEPLTDLAVRNPATDKHEEPPEPRNAPVTRTSEQADDASPLIESRDTGAHPIAVPPAEQVLLTGRPDFSARGTGSNLAVYVASAATLAVFVVTMTSLMALTQLTASSAERRRGPLSRGHLGAGPLKQLDTVGSTSGETTMNVSTSPALTLVSSTTGWLDAPGTQAGRRIARRRKSADRRDRRRRRRRPFKGSPRMKPAPATSPAKRD